MTFTRTRNITNYVAIKELSESNTVYSISALCNFASITRAAYYKWLNHVNSDNDNSLVFDTFDKAVVENPEATPIFHSDRGYQYTSRAFRQRILDAGMTQSMSRVGRCIDNGPMEGFWGLMKREMYYGKKYKTKEELVKAIEQYLDYYANKRVQRNLGILTPMEYHTMKLQNVA